MSAINRYPRPIETKADLSAAIRWFESAGGAALLRLPLLRSLLADQIAFLDLGPLTTPARMVKAFLGTADKPALVVVGDDGELPVGPRAVPQLTRLARWARLIVVHAAGGQVGEYEQFVSQTLTLGRLLVIECSAEMARDYTAFCRRAAPTVHGMLIVPPGHEGPLQ